MRTSRISRETARVVNAVPLTERRSTRSSLRGFANNEYTPVDSSKQESNCIDHDLSAPPLNSGNAKRTANSSLGKRKRENANIATKSGTGETTTIRRSPRKQPAVEDGKSAQKPSRQPAKRISGPNGQLTVEPPRNWETVYNTTASQRKRVLAPVDTMGCESLAEEHRSPRDKRLQTLVSLMLSSQTKDAVTAAAIRSLQEKLPGGLCLESLLNVEPTELNKLIEKVGFHNNKTKFIKSVAVFLCDKYGGDIPDTIDGLVSLPGVGPKMAYLCMSAAWGRDEGIGVDVHVHRITNLWGWHKTSTPEQTRAELEAWLPRDKWHDINHLLVGFGQTICLPIGRKCDQCDLAAEGLCPSVVTTKSSPAKKRVKENIEIKVEDGEADAVRTKEWIMQTDAEGVKTEAEIEDDGNVAVGGGIEGDSGIEGESSIKDDSGNEDDSSEDEYVCQATTLATTAAVLVQQ